MALLGTGVSLVRFVQCNERSGLQKIRGEMTGIVIMSSLGKGWNAGQEMD
jgi:hypothetical protein